MTTSVIKVSGMSCQGCVRSVASVLQALPGVSGVEVSLERGEARVDHDAAQAGLAEIKRAVIEAGFEAP